MSTPQFGILGHRDIGYIFLGGFSLSALGVRLCFGNVFSLTDVLTMCSVLLPSTLQPPRTSLLQPHLTVTDALMLPHPSSISLTVTDAQLITLSISDSIISSPPSLLRMHKSNSSILLCYISGCFSYSVAGWVTLIYTIAFNFSN